MIKEIIFKGDDGKQITLIGLDEFGYFSLVGICEGAISEFIERPEEVIEKMEQIVEHDG